jgi:Raf kinase inhibitor-like YbhB/YbcL family protein
MRKINCILSGLLSILIPSAYADTFSLHSNSFTSLHPLAPVYTCDGTNISPELDWKNAPDGTKSFALILSDPDAPSGTFYHWVVYNIGKNVTALPENVSANANDVKTGANSWGRKKYSGPCPPQGQTHHYIFTLYALDTSMVLPPDTDAQTLLKAMQQHNHILATAELRTVYGH